MEMGMENETRKFLILIVNSISIVLLWMLLNVVFGIYLEFGFFDNSPGWKNWLYYALAVGSLVFVVRLLIKKWKQVSLKDLMQ